MSLDAIQNVVLLFSNPVWSGTSSSSETVIRNLTALDTQIAYESLFDTNLTTISTNEASTTNGILQGLLYVPTLDSSHPCSATQYEDPVYLPRNVTQKDDLPQANYKLISIAPWYNDSCTTAYLNAVRYDPIQAFIFYRPAGDVEYTQDEDKEKVDKEAWRPKGAGENWAKKYRFPIYALPKDSGNELIATLAAYSGSLDTVPYSDNITQLFDTSSADYVRVWTQMRVHNEDKETPLWEFFVITFASLVGIILLVSLSLHMVQWRRRYNLGQKVKSGEVDLEAMGIARVSVPMDHIKENFILYTYQQDPEISTTTEIPNGTDTSTSKSTVETTTHSESNYTAVGTNHQPTCQVCHMGFENRVSVIRQLPCFHIFHAECIEEYLHRVSCLCPLCRQSMLPERHCPQITNGMVHKERRLHKLRGQLSDDDEDDKSLRRKIRWKWWRRKDYSHSQGVLPVIATPLPIPVSVEHAATAVDTAVTVTIQTPPGRGRRSPGTRRREIREFAEELEERETCQERERGIWRRAVLRVFPTVG